MQPPARHQGYCRSAWLPAALLTAISLTFTSAQAQPRTAEPKALQPSLPSLQQATVTLAKATTPDAKTVVVAYVILGANANSIHFDLYRSPTSDATATSILSVDDANPADLTTGEHSVSLTPAAGLPPNTAAPYVVVVASSGGQKSAVYFRKFLIGVIAHGFDKWAFANNWSPLNLVSVPAWETTMAWSLKSMDHYDDVIAFNWTQTCASPKPEMAVHAGLRLANEIAERTVIRSQHPGDVVDLHLIGHSRGAVVVAQALKDMAAQDPLLGGGFVQVTLLDPHPANNCFAAECPASDSPESTWAGFARDARGQFTPAAQIAQKRAIWFQQNAADPPVAISAGIKKVEVWYQHTAANCLTARPGQEQVMNLWGTVDSAALIDQSGLMTQPTDKTSCSEAIGHSQIPRLYELTVVDTGKLNRAP